MEAAWARWVAILAVVLLVGVSLAMCAGLGDDKPRAPATRPMLADPSETESEPETEPDPETGPAPEDGGGGAEEPLPDGVRVISGTVSDQDGEPIDRAEVGLVGSKRRSTETDADGGYRLRGVPLGKVELVVRARGYADEHVTLAIGEPGVEERLDVSLEDGDVVVGMVVDQHGKPVARARVSCADHPRDAALSAETDYAGMFELPGRAVGCDAIARHAGHPDSPRVPMELGPRNLIALGVDGSIAGTVVDATGAPVRAFVLAIESFTPAAGSTPPPQRRYHQTYNTPEGTFAIHALAPGTYVLKVSVSGHADVLSESIALKHGEQRRDLQIAVH